MRIDILHIGRAEAGILQRVNHRTARTIHVRRSDVISIGTHAIARHFSVNLCATRLGMFVLFEHQHTGPLAQHKTVAILVPRATGSRRVVVARGQRTGCAKAAHAQRRYCRLCAAGDHHVGIAVLDHAGGFADRMGAGCTGRNNRHVRALEAENDRQVA